MKLAELCLKKVMLFSLLLIIVLLPVGRKALARESQKTIYCYVMSVEGDWQIAGDLPRQALIISLQGLVNRTGPRLYVLVGQRYDYLDNDSILAYYHQYQHVDYTTINSIPDALRKFRKFVK